MHRMAVLWLCLLLVGGARAEHVAKIEIKEIEWNGTLKLYGPDIKKSIRFNTVSEAVFLDSFKGAQLWMRIYFVPVFSDKDEIPGYHAVIFDSAGSSKLWTKSIYEKNTHIASSREKDEDGQRRWAGTLRYVPDNTVHSPRPAWRQDHFTFMIGDFQAWRDLKMKNKENLNAKKLKRLYFDGYTGKTQEPIKAGKIGSEKLELVLDPVRYQWGSESWIEFTVRLFSTDKNGKRSEILAHKFDSRNQQIQFQEHNVENAYEIRDFQKTNYMLMKRVYLIPF